MSPVQVLQEPLYSQKPIFIALNRQKFKMSPSATTNSKTVPFELRLGLHGRSFQSKRFHDLETASKTTRFQRVYTEPIQPLNPTVYVKAISFSGLCASSIALFTVNFSHLHYNKIQNVCEAISG